MKREGFLLSNFVKFNMNNIINHVTQSYQNYSMISTKAQQRNKEFEKRRNKEEAITPNLSKVRTYLEVA